MWTTERIARGSDELKEAVFIITAGHPVGKPIKEEKKDAAN